MIGNSESEISKTVMNKVIKPGFENLRIWKKAYDLMLKIHELCKSLPKDERFQIKDQIERSSSSVMDNISEAYATYYYNDKIKCSYISRKEAAETQNHIRKMEGKQYIDAETAEALIQEYEGLIRGINAFINSVKQKRDNDKKY